MTVSTKGPDMAKRYYNSSRRERNSAGMAAHRNRNGMSMISTDYSAPALLPQQVIDKYWAENEFGMPVQDVKDLYSGVVSADVKDIKNFKKIMKPSQY